MEEGSRRTKDGRFIEELVKDRAMIRILILYVKIESKCSAF